ncbi:MAG: SMC-Scp complex subunit ScpB [Planctomycetota bacterium]|jgi:segregation and condensation protein B
MSNEPETTEAAENADGANAANDGFDPVPEETVTESFPVTETLPGDKLPAGPMPQDALATKVEALLFVHHKPLTNRRLADILGLQSVIPVNQALEALQKRYLDTGNAFTLQNLAQGWQMTTRPEHEGMLGKLVRQKEAQKLSPATLEAVAIIAYKQPIGRLELENIRGVGSDHLVRALLDRGLIKVTERDSTKPGNPAMYGTTGEFLRAFGLRSISELPQEGDLVAPEIEEEGSDEEQPVIEQTEISAPEEE